VLLQELRSNPAQLSEALPQGRGRFGDSGARRDLRDFGRRSR
jgi:hypothetical protein